MPNPPQPGSYRIDAEQSTVAFVSRHMLTKVRGRFLSFDGVIVVRDPVETSGVDVHIEAESITTGVGVRDKHLRSDDFMQVAVFPQLSFTSERVRPVAGARFEMDGALTIRGIQKPVTLAGIYIGAGGGDRLRATATTTIDRYDWDMTWSDTVETGGIMVGRKVEISIDVDAVRE
jgi:polyisoprenoid-binding protein YceI